MIGGQQGGRRRRGQPLATPGPRPGSPSRSARRA
jgi:hypothetical protein